MDSSNQEEDLKAIESVMSKDTGAFAVLVRKYQARILRLCNSLLKNSTDAEDAAQEVFVKAYQSLDRFRWEASFYTWLYRIASNHCLDRLRSKQRRSVESLDSLLEKEGSQVEALFAASPDPKDSIAAADLVARLLASLPPNYRLIITLREVEGLTYEEISQVLKTSLDSVKAQLRRARQEIEEKLRHFLP